jgi:23S rRNA (adenine2503-C2)-methyltransferase
MPASATPKALQAGYISNIVFMGMGEPLANYEHVKAALRTILGYTDIGPTRITVSTVGLVPMLRHLLGDPEWPPVRLAVSLHSADEATRKRMMPSSFDGFLDELAAWAGEYFKRFESKRRHLTFEYVMLAGVNDTAAHAEALIRFARRIGKARINLIPYNFTPHHSRKGPGKSEGVSADAASPHTVSKEAMGARNGTGQAPSAYRGSLPGDFARFEERLRGAGIDVTRRRSMGDDIAAACGQLVTERNRS